MCISVSGVEKEQQNGTGGAIALTPTEQRVLQFISVQAAINLINVIYAGLPQVSISSLF